VSRLLLPIVYVAGPITTPNPMHNTSVAVRKGNALQRTGVMLPIVPHLTVLADMIDPHDYEWYMRYDLALIRRVDALYRLRGESSGADREVAHAKEIGKPVFFEGEKRLDEGAWHDLLDWCEDWINRENAT
jgi:hypothetical protein